MLKGMITMGLKMNSDNTPKHWLGEIYELQRYRQTEFVIDQVVSMILFLSWGSGLGSGDFLMPSLLPQHSIQPYVRYILNAWAHHFHYKDFHCASQSTSNPTPRLTDTFDRTPTPPPAKKEDKNQPSKAKKTSYGK